MFLIRPLFLSVIFFTLAFTQNAFAAIPASIDGQAIPSLAPMIEKTRPAVVNIATRGSVDIQNHPLLNDPLFKRFFKGFENLPQRKEVKSLGSGVIIDEDAGYIVTNFHVIDGADEISITLHDGRQLEAKIIGSDPEADIAILKVDEDGLISIPFALGSLYALIPSVLCIFPSYNPHPLRRQQRTRRTRGLHRIRQKNAPSTFPWDMVKD